MLLSFIVQFVLYLSSEKNENKEIVWPIKKACSRLYLVNKNSYSKISLTEETEKSSAIFAAFYLQ